MKGTGEWRKRLPAILLLGFLGALTAGTVRAQQSQPQANAGAVAEFESKVREYMKAHRSAEKGLPHLKAAASGEQIVERQTMMAERIRAARAKAKEGGVFTPEVSAYFARRIKAAYEENAEAIRACLAAGSPLPDLNLKSNTTYPENLSYTIMPPTILRYLPSLPKELRYQVVCNDLILRDVEANLVVDVLRNALP